MVGAGGPAAAGERLRHAFGGGAAGAVDDAALVLALADEVDDLLQRLVLRDDAVGEVGPVEAGDEGGRLAQPEVLDDVGAHPLGRGGGEGHERHLGQDGAELGQLAELGAEIMAPFGDAVRLVDGEARHVPVFQVFLPALEHEPFGRGVEELVFALMQAAQAGAGFRRAKGGVEKRRGHAAGGELVHLVLHQRDERRHDDGEAGPHEGGELEAKGFAAAGRQEGEHIPPGERCLADLALERTKGGVTEGGLERFEQGGHGGTRHASTRGRQRNPRKRASSRTAPAAAWPRRTERETTASRRLGRSALGSTWPTSSWPERTGRA